jgi:adenylylsulfate kinase-like enzyme
VPGVDVPYEPALAADLTIDTTVDDVVTAAAKVAALAGRLAASGTGACACASRAS